MYPGFMPIAKVDWPGNAIDWVKETLGIIIIIVAKSASSVVALLMRSKSRRCVLA
jgi:hypothetical protein